MSQAMRRNDTAYLFRGNSYVTIIDFLYSGGIRP